MSWQSVPRSPHWKGVNINNKYKKHWKLFAQTKRYDDVIIPHYITLVAEDDEDYREGVGFLNAAKHKGLYNCFTKKINMKAFKNQQFFWLRSGATDSGDFVKATKRIQFNGVIFIAPGWKYFGVAEPHKHSDTTSKRDYPESGRGEIQETLEGGVREGLEEAGENPNEISERKIGQHEAERATFMKGEKIVAQEETVVFQNAGYQNRITQLENLDAWLACCSVVESQLEGFQRQNNRQATRPSSTTAPECQPSYVITDDEEEEKGEPGPKRAKHGGCDGQPVTNSTNSGKAPKFQRSYVITDDGEEEKDEPEPKRAKRGGCNGQPVTNSTSSAKAPKRQRSYVTTDDEEEEKDEPEPKRAKRGGRNVQPVTHSTSGSTNSRAKGWSDTEKAALASEMRLYKEESAHIDPKNIMRDTRLFEYMSSRLASRHSIYRSANGCKNEWNRRGREQSGIENRIKLRSRSNSMSTSVQRAKGAHGG